MAADKQLIGLCGEHFVAALLAGYDLAVSLVKWPNTAEASVVFFVPSAFVAKRMESQASRKRPFFEAFESDLDQYRGAKGVALLKANLGGRPMLSAPYGTADAGSVGHETATNRVADANR